MAALIIRPDAETDLDELYDVDPDTAAFIEVVLEEVFDNERLIEMLCRDRTRNLRDPTIENERFIELWNLGYTMYRLKMWREAGELISHRALHTNEGHNDRVYVLGVLHRDYAYDTRHNKVQRCVADYEALGIYRAH